MPKTKPDNTPEKETIVELQAKLQQLDAEAQELHAKAEAVKPPAPKESTPLPSDERLASDATEEEVARAQILRDPFDTRNALKILADPPGKKLRWISVSYREMRDMRGWQAVWYNDPIGREAHRYIGDPPSRMFGSAEADAVIRRGDLVLAWIDIGIWAARQRERSEKSARKMSAHTSKSQKPVGDFGATVGEGLQTDENPYQHVRKAPGFVDPDEAAYRARAKGDVTDPAQRVPGRNLFEEAPDEE